MSEYIVFATMILIIILLLYIMIGTRKEHEAPGFGIVGQRGLDGIFSVSENFYTSGAGLRDKSRPDLATQQTIDQNDFGKRELDYYLRH
jgi:hypothetical protein